MAFQLDFPPGWRTANSKSAVEGLSPQEDALLVLTLTEGTSPAAAVGSFLAQDGVSGGPARERTLHGLSSAVADFRHTTQNDTLQGRVTVVRHQGSLFRVLGVASTEDWEDRRDAIRQTLDSFRPLTDSRVLNVQPARLRIITVRQAMDLESFLRPQGASVDIEEIRLLNRLEGNPTLEPGRRLKVPVGGSRGRG
jgi:predicted Zn-dependent protease